MGNWLLPGIWITVQLTVTARSGRRRRLRRRHRPHLRLWIVRFLAGLLHRGLPRHLGAGADVLAVLRAAAGFGWQLVPMWAGVLALGLTYGAYGSEIVRGALDAVDPGAARGGDRAQLHALRSGCG